MKDIADVANFSTLGHLLSFNIFQIVQGLQRKLNSSGWNRERCQ